ncbi:hypothetical protein DAI22_09g028600 [Oryza sativa Japonica Group]|nr:hypothetical protein DAI22_09g028600 [Oryza sativa Japonica Group]
MTKKTSQVIRAAPHRPVRPPPLRRHTPPPPPGRARWRRPPSRPAPAFPAVPLAVVSCRTSPRRAASRGRQVAARLSLIKPRLLADLAAASSTGAPPHRTPSPPSTTCSSAPTRTRAPRLDRTGTAEALELTIPRASAALIPTSSPPLPPTNRPSRRRRRPPQTGYHFFSRRRHAFLRVYCRRRDLQVRPRLVRPPPARRNAKLNALCYNSPLDKHTR